MLLFIAILKTEDYYGYYYIIVDVTAIVNCTLSRERFIIEKLAAPEIYARPFQKCLVAKLCYKSSTRETHRRRINPRSEEFLGRESVCEFLWPDDRVTSLSFDLPSTLSFAFLIAHRSHCRIFHVLHDVLSVLLFFLGVVPLSARAGVKRNRRSGSDVIVSRRK